MDPVRSGVKRTGGQCFGVTHIESPPPEHITRDAMVSRILGQLSRNFSVLRKYPGKLDF